MSQVEHESPGWIVRCGEALARAHAGAMFVTALLMLGISSCCRTVPFLLGFNEAPAPRLGEPLRVLYSLIYIVDDLLATLAYPLAMFAIGRLIADAIIRRSHTE